MRNERAESHTLRCLDSLAAHLANLHPFSLVGHGLKFDLKTLAAHGLDLSSHWSDDTLLMAAALTEKIPTGWGEHYERERKRLNAGLPRGSLHRPFSSHSLKSLAPYFLGVPAFWEDPGNHDSETYVLKDVEYTHGLYYELKRRLEVEGSYEFYKTRLLPWTQMLLRMESRGVALDIEGLEISDSQSRQATQELRAKLDTLWSEAALQWKFAQVLDIQEEYAQKAEAAVTKLKDKSKAAATRARYKEMAQRAAAKLEPLNIDSPTQLTWLLRDYLGLDIKDFFGEETTGKPVLQRLSEREDIKTFLEYRKHKKLTSAFFPTYRELHHNGILHCSFNPTGTRTGRLSSSGPNLQQVPGHLHKLFKARPGHLLATYDFSAIEPRLIAYYSNDRNLFDIIVSGQDFHGHTTRVLFEREDWDPATVKDLHPLERKLGKEIGLSLFYGAGTGRIQQSAQKYGFSWSRADCQRKLERFRDYYRGVFSFRDSEINPILKAGGLVSNLLGRQFRIQDPDDVHLQGMNTLIQSSASDLMLHSAHKMQGRLAEIDAHVVLLVHDEIIVETPTQQAEACVNLVTDALTNHRLECAYGRIPLAVEGKVAPSWEK